jgi:hypothetical protein
MDMPLVSESIPLIDAMIATLESMDQCGTLKAMRQARDHMTGLHPAREHVTVEPNAPGLWGPEAFA